MINRSKPYQLKVRVANSKAHDTNRATPWNVFNISTFVANYYTQRTSIGTHHIQNELVAFITDWQSTLTGAIQAATTTSTYVAKCICGHWLITYGNSNYLPSNSGLQLVRIRVSMLRILLGSNIWLQLHSSIMLTDKKKFHKKFVTCQQHYYNKHWKDWNATAQYMKSSIKVHRTKRNISDWFFCLANIYLHCQ